MLATFPLIQESVPEDGIFYRYAQQVQYLAPGDLCGQEMEGLEGGRPLQALTGRNRGKVT